MRTPENRLLPMSAIAAMLVATSTIVGLAYWVGDAIAPGLASVVQVSTRSVVPAGTRTASRQAQGTSAASASTDGAKTVLVAPARAERVDAGRDR